MTKKRIYVNNNIVTELECNKNRCVCNIVQYAIGQGIRPQIKYDKKNDIEKIGFRVKDFDEFVAQANTRCDKCK